MSTTRTLSNLSPTTLRDRILKPRTGPITFDELRIETKTQDLVRFHPNAVQAEYLDHICPDWRDGALIAPAGLREIVLKARQFGFSTLIAAIFFVATVNTPNTTTVVVAHDAETAEELFQIVHRFWENLPEARRPATRYHSRRQLFWPSINSRYLVRTAGSRGAGRGLTINNLHCSEAAFYGNPKLFTGLLQAVPRGGNVFVESTANGESGDGKVFHDEYRRAKQGGAAFTARFYAWWQHGEYETEPPAGWRRDADDETIARKHDLDGRFGRAVADRKLAWRRAKRSEPGMGSLVAQEFPGDDREAFLVSGTRFFTDWDEERHVVFEQDVTIERHWQMFGGYDWGYGAPACFLLACVDEQGRVLVLDELYLSRLTDPEQAEAVRACIDRWAGARGGLWPLYKDTLIYADPSMWAQKTDWSGKRVQNVLAFHQAGLRFVKAANDRVAGWQNVRRYLHDGANEYLHPVPPLPQRRERGLGGEGRTQPGAEGRTDSGRGSALPFLRVLRGRCPNLIRTASLMIHDRHPEDADTTVEDHAWDALRYLLSARPRPSGLAEVQREDWTPSAGQPDPRPAWMRKRKRRGFL